MNTITTKKGTVLVIRPTLKSIGSKLRRSLKTSKMLRGRLRRTMSNDSEAQTKINLGLNQQRGYRGAIRRYIGAITNTVRPNKHAKPTAAIA